jgi:hypothetical protein
MIVKPDKALAPGFAIPGCYDENVAYGSYG